MAIDIETAKTFVRLWVERYPKCIIEAPNRIGGELVRSTIEDMARDFNCTPKEAYYAAMELRAAGVRLAPKENEERYAPREKAEFNWLKFGELLIKTRKPSIVCEAFDLSDDQFIRLTEVLTRSGVRIPPLQLGRDIPEWLANRMALAINPKRYSPEEKRTIRIRYRKHKAIAPSNRPKGKKRTYFAGGSSVYNPRGQQKRTKHMFRRPDRAQLQFLANMYA